MQPLQLHAQFPDLALALVALSPLADVAAKPLDLDSDVLLTATPIARWGRRHIATAIATTTGMATAVTGTAAAAITNHFLENGDLGAQRIDRLRRRLPRRRRAAAAGRACRAADRRRR
jgi:hypothetical protein